MANSPSKPSQHSNSASLSAENLAQQLNQLAEQYKIKTWCLAYSGGIDSQVLLHLLHLTKLNVIAVYIDHGLQTESSAWAKHCEQQCKQLEIPFQCIQVNASPEKRQSPEAAARTARYAALKKIVLDGVCLLTAQHQDDQAETVLLQLLRGGGAAGLAAMPEINSFSKGWHCRPLLETTQQAIKNYANQNQLKWVEDPSNQQQQYDRNYLRHTVIPAIQQRWTSMNKTLTVFAQQQAENSNLLDALAEIDLRSVLQSDNSLDILRLTELDNARLRNTLRFWIKSFHGPMPSRAVLQQIVQQIFNPSHDTHALISWADVEVRRYKDSLYLLNKISHDASQVIEWDGTGSLYVPSLDKHIQFEQRPSTKAQSFVLKAEVLSLPLIVRFRQGGERIRPAGRSGRHDLKSLFQEAAVPPWQRDRIPLLYTGEVLIAVTGYWLADEFAVKGEGVIPGLH